MARRKKFNLRRKEQLKLLYCTDYMKIGKVTRLSSDDLYMADGSNGVRLPVVDAKGNYEIGRSKPSTCFPSFSCLACSFEPDVAYIVGKSIGQECKANNIGMLLAPSLNIKRNPLGGRNFEYLSEDPLLNGVLGVSYVEGVQSEHVGCCVKHFAANNQESYRMINDSILDQRCLHEIYLKPFEMVVKQAKPWGLMASYNKINGIYSVQNDILLNGLVRETWGYDGIIMSDWGGMVNHITDHNKGVDVELSPCSSRYNELLAAYTRGKLYKQDVRNSSRRVFEIQKTIKQFADYKPSFSDEDHYSVALKAAQKSIVLLENDGILPLKSLDGVSVIGALAQNPRIQGAGSNMVNPTKVITFLDAIKKCSKGNVELHYAKGYELDNTVISQDLMVDAVDLASRSKIVILHMGLFDNEEGEGFDKAGLQVSESQLRLFDAIYSVNQNIILILNTGSPVEVPFAKKCRAVLLPYLGGEAMEEALATIILGQVSPSGRLPESWPLHLSDVPSFGFYPGPQTQSLYRESIYVGYRYYLSTKKNVAYPFGYGLSYANFKVSNFALSNSYLKTGGTINVSVDVQNVSKITSGTVIQLYAEPVGNNIFKPLRYLIAFKKVYVDAGKSKKVVFSLDASSFTHFDVESSTFKVEGGTYKICLCSDCTKVVSSLDLTVEGETFENKRSVLPIYYEPNRDGFLQYENDFENLLGRSVFVAKDPKSRPFTMNSTISDLERTWVGKRILKIMTKKPMFTSKTGLGQMSQHGLKETPLRTVALYMKNERFAYIICDLANGHPLRAFRHLILGPGYRYD